MFSQKEATVKNKTKLLQNKKQKQNHKINFSISATLSSELLASLNDSRVIFLSLTYLRRQFLYIHSYRFLTTVFLWTRWTNSNKNFHPTRICDEGNKAFVCHMKKLFFKRLSLILDAQLGVKLFRLTLKQYRSKLFL